MPPRARPLADHALHPPGVLLVLYNFGALVAEWGIGFWLPSVVKETGPSIGRSACWPRCPTPSGVVMMVLVARSSDRRHERKWHMIAATSGSGIFLFWRSSPRVAVPSDRGVPDPGRRRLPRPVRTVLDAADRGAADLRRRGRDRSDQRRGQSGRHRRPVVFGYVRDTDRQLHPGADRGGISLILASLVAIPIRASARLRAARVAD